MTPLANLMIKSTRSIVMAICILEMLVAGCSRPPREPFALRWKLEKGAVYRIQFEQSASVEIKKGGMPERRELQQLLSMVWTTDSVDDDGNAWITLKFDRLRLTGVGEDQKRLEYDSLSSNEPKGEAARMAEQFRGLLDVSLGVQLSPRGEILKVTRSREFDGVPGLEARRLTSKSGLQGLLALFVGVFPERKLRTGDSWEWSSTRSLLQRATLTYTYNGLHRHNGQPLARIDITPNHQSVPKPDKDTNRTTQKVDAVAWFDPTAGVLKEAVIHTTIENSKPGENGNEERKAEITVKWTLTTD